MKQVIRINGELIPGLYELELKPSSRVARIRFQEQPSNNGYLQVDFQSGGVYRYLNVPRSVAENLEKAESVGKAMNDIIKNYEYLKLC